MIPVAALQTYEDCVSHGIALVEALDRNRWALGDLAENVTAQYGDETFDTFAGEIGIPRKTLYEYRRVSRFYPLSARQIFEDTNLTYSHLRDALRCEHLADATIWLAEVSDQGWTVDQAAYKLTERLGREHREEGEPLVKRTEATLYALEVEHNEVGMRTGYLLTFRIKELPENDIRDYLWGHMGKITPLEISVWRAR